MESKRKIINDPVYGFISIPNKLVLDLIKHPFFQRLRRIKQLGLAELVYPGAVHTRFQHALGAMYLMNLALDKLQSKGVLIMDVERESALAAILLHDVGHGPFSHVLEYKILSQVHHEEVTLLGLHSLNKELDGKLDLAIKMFEGSYHRNFFHQLISGQLDMDRLDYIKRDSFFTGVAEGTIGVDRLISMLQIHQDNLVVEEKGLLSVENFLNARRLMYWQVYLHKTSIAAEVILDAILTRVKELIQEDEMEVQNQRLRPFLLEKWTLDKLTDAEGLSLFMSLDDLDIWSSIKDWSMSKDKILSKLSKRLLFRDLYKLKFNPSKEDKAMYMEKLLATGIKEETLHFFLKTGSISNAGYVPENSSINILRRDGTIVDVAEASDLPNIKALTQVVKKEYLCWSNVD